MSPRKATRRKVDTKIKKELLKEKPVTKAKKPKDQRYVAERNVEKMKELGYKVVGDGKDKQGKVYMSSTMHGLTIQSNGRNFVDGTDAKQQATWRGAVGDLESRQLIEDLGRKREVFRVTDKGYKAAEALRN